MSKEAALRAMREARYNARSAASTGAPKPARPAAGPAAGPAARTPEPRRAEPVAPAPSADVVCGHRSMNGRTCTREQGHAAKSHRYS